MCPTPCTDLMQLPFVSMHFFVGPRVELIKGHLVWIGIHGPLGFVGPLQLISTCGKGTGPRPAFDVYAAMLRQAVNLDMVSYCALICACDRGKEMRRAFDVCADMLRQDMKPTMVSYSEVTSASAKGE